MCTHSSHLTTFSILDVRCKHSQIAAVREEFVKCRKRLIGKDSIELNDMYCRMFRFELKFETSSSDLFKNSDD